MVRVKIFIEDTLSARYILFCYLGVIALLKISLLQAAEDIYLCLKPKMLPLKRCSNSPFGAVITRLVTETNYLNLADFGCLGGIATAL